MRRIPLGNTGEKIPSIGLGFWQAGSPLWGTKGVMTPHDAAGLLRAAAEEGIELIDTAEAYGWGESERLLGEALRLVEAEFLIATKASGFRWGADDIARAAERSRRRLGVDAIDLFQHHWPPPFYASLCTVAQGLEKAVDQGHARYVGVSNYDSRLLARMLECFHRHEPVSNQVQYSLAYRLPENRLLPLHREKGVTTIAWSPLAKGALSASNPQDLSKRATRAQRSDPVFRKALDSKRLHNVLEEIAGELGATKSQVALAWLVHKGALPIPGTRRPERVREYARAGSLELTAGQVERLDIASRDFLGPGDYRALSGLRLVPGLLQMLVVRLMGGF